MCSGPSCFEILHGPRVGHYSVPRRCSAAANKRRRLTALPSRLGRLHWRPFIKRAKRTVCSLRFLKHEPSALCAYVSREGTQAQCRHVLRNYMIIRANRRTAALVHPVLLRSSGVHAFQLQYGLTSSLMGSGDSSVVRTPDSWLKSRGFQSLAQERRENFLLQGRLSVLTLISVSVPPPCYRSST